MKTDSVGRPSPTDAYGNSRQRTSYSTRKNPNTQRTTKTGEKTTVHTLIRSIAFSDMNKDKNIYRPEVNMRYHKTGKGNYLNNKQSQEQLTVTHALKQTHHS
jgi:hypothetical protein